MKTLLLVVSLFSLSSCKMVMLKMMLKDPKVETTQSIREFQTRNNYSTENSLIIRADTSDALQKLFLGLAVGYYIFDSTGNLVCYNGSSTCHGVQFKQLLDNKADSFKSCRNEGVTLDKILAEAYDLDEKPVIRTQLKDADYYVVSYWQKFLGGKKGYEDAVTWMEDEIKKNNSPLKFTFIKINTDLQENWGLVAGKKAKLKYKRRKDNMTLYVSKLPVKK